MAVIRHTVSRASAQPHRRKNRCHPYDAHRVLHRRGTCHRDRVELRGTHEPRLVPQHQGEPRGHFDRPWLQGVLPRRGTGWSRTRPTLPPRGGCIVAIRSLPAVGGSPTDRRDRLPPDRVTAACCRLAGFGAFTVRVATKPTV